MVTRNTKEFEKFYKAQIEPLEDEFNQLRQPLHKQRYLRFIVSTFVFLAYSSCVILFLKYLNGEYESEAHRFLKNILSNNIKLMIGITFCSLFVLLPLSFWTNHPRRCFYSRIKKIIYPKILSYFGLFFYDEESPYKLIDFKESAILPRKKNLLDFAWRYPLTGNILALMYHKQKVFQDFFCGEYKSVSIDFSQVCIGDFYSVYPDLPFYGIFIRLSMNKKFDGQTIVTADKAYFKKYKKMRPVILEDPEFSKKFQVYATDQVESRYLLTTSFMERLKSLASLYSSGAVRCSFYNKHVLLMLPLERDLFKPISGLDAPVDFRQDAYMLQATLNEIFAIIDTLKLNERTGV